MASRFEPGAGSPRESERGGSGAGGRGWGIAAKDPTNRANRKPDSGNAALGFNGGPGTGGSNGALRNRALRSGRSGRFLNPGQKRNGFRWGQIWFFRGGFGRDFGWGWLGGWFLGRPGALIGHLGDQRALVPKIRIGGEDSAQFQPLMHPFGTVLAHGFGPIHHRLFHGFQKRGQQGQQGTPPFGRIAIPACDQTGPFALALIVGLSVLGKQTQPGGNRLGVSFDWSVRWFHAHPKNGTNWILDPAAPWVGGVLENPIRLGLFQGLTIVAFPIIDPPQWIRGCPWLHPAKVPGMGPP